MTSEGILCVTLSGLQDVGNKLSFAKLNEQTDMPVD